MNFEDIYLIRKLDDPDCDRVVSVIEDIEFAMKGMPIITDVKDVKESTLIITIGGDGTAVEGIKLSARTGAVVMCVNLGQVGFLADFEPVRLFEYMRYLDSGVIKIEERSLTQAWNCDDKAVAVNDIVISRLYADEMLAYDLFVNGSFAGKHRANGVIISTPTGSTAYALSAGGAILHPNVDCVEIIPIAAATMTSRPIIVPSDAEILVKINPKALRGQSKQVVVRADGQVVNGLGCDVDDSASFTIHLTGYERKAKILHQHSWNYFDTLTQKLNWNK